MVVARRIILAIFIRTTTSSTMVIHTLDYPAMSTRLFDFSSIVLLPMVIKYLNDCACAHRFSIAAQFKIMGETSSITGLWFDFIQLCSSKYKIV
jgi:hypothetical protein